MFALVSAIMVVVVSLIVGIVGSKSKGNQRKMEADEIKTGTSTEGTEIPIVFGTVKITNPIYTWIGDKSLEAIRKKGGKK